MKIIKKKLLIINKVNIIRLKKFYKRYFFKVFFNKLINLLIFFILFLLLSIILSIYLFLYNYYNVEVSESDYVFNVCNQYTLDNDNILKQLFNNYMDLFRNKSIKENFYIKYKDIIIEYKGYKNDSIGISANKYINNAENLKIEITELKKEICLLKQKEIKYNIDRVYTIKLIDDFIQEWKCLKNAYNINS
jgi:hypothetical protein